MKGSACYNSTFAEQGAKCTSKLVHHQFIALLAASKALDDLYGVMSSFLQYKHIQSEEHFEPQVIAAYWQGFAGDHLVKITRPYKRNVEVSHRNAGEEAICIRERIVSGILNMCILFG